MRSARVDCGRVLAQGARTRLFAGIPGEYDAAGALLSFGQDPRWRRALVAALALAPTDRVLDVATGTGLVAAALIARHGCSVVGVDQSDEMLGRAGPRQRTDRSFAARCELLARRGRLVSQPWYDVGRFLGPSIASFAEH